jgi:hypothetical protein
MRFATTLLPCLSVPPQAGRLSVPFTCAYSARESNERSTKYSISSDSRKCKHRFYSLERLVYERIHQRSHHRLDTASAEEGRGGSHTARA